MSSQSHTVYGCEHVAFGRTYFSAQRTRQHYTMTGFKLRMNVKTSRLADGRWDSSAAHPAVMDLFQLAELILLIIRSPEDQTWYRSAQTSCRTPSTHTQQPEISSPFNQPWSSDLCQVSQQLKRAWWICNVTWSLPKDQSPIPTTSQKSSTLRWQRSSFATCIHLILVSFQKGNSL